MSRTRAKERMGTGEALAGRRQMMALSAALAAAAGVMRILMHLHRAPPQASGPAKASRAGVPAATLSRTLGAAAPLAAAAAAAARRATVAAAAARVAPAVRPQAVQAAAAVTSAAAARMETGKMGWWRPIRPTACAVLPGRR